LSIESWVDFYTHLTSDLKFYHIGLVPFDAIVLRYGYLGLVLPGIGDDRYLPMARVLYNILERLLPVDDPTIRMCNDSASGYTMDGFRWLHGIFTNFLPAFSPYITATPPLWHEVRDISRSAKLYNLYYRFLALQSVYHTDIVRSRAFLAGIDEESLRPSIISLQTGLVNFTNRLVGEFDDPTELPPHFGIDGLAAALIKSTTPVSTSMALSYPTANSTFAPRYYQAYDDYPFTFGTANSTSRPSSYTRPFSRDRRPPGRGYRPPSRERSHRRVPSNDASQQSGPVEFCKACSERHPVERCWKVARALIIQRFIKQNIGSDLLSKIEKAYNERFDPKPSARANATSAAFLEAYCAESGMSGQEIADQFDWDGLVSHGASDSPDWQDAPESN
jgi:hypothetical protein